MKRIGVYLALAMSLLVVLASPARAAKPSVQTIHTELSDFPLEDCGDFEVILDLSHDETITTYFDSSGAPTSATFRFNFDATLTNSVTGKTAFEKGASIQFVDFSGGEGHVAGLILQIRVPGQGVVLMEVGELDFDQAGHAELSGEPVVIEGDSLFCTILR
jgi:hypothetical protein